MSLAAAGTQRQAADVFNFGNTMIDMQRTYTPAFIDGMTNARREIIGEPVRVEVAQYPSRPTRPRPHTRSSNNAVEYAPKRDRATAFTASEITTHTPRPKRRGSIIAELIACIAGAFASRRIKSNRGHTLHRPGVA